MPSSHDSIFGMTKAAWLSQLLVWFLQDDHQIMLNDCKHQIFIFYAHLQTTTSTRI